MSAPLALEHRGVHPMLVKLVGGRRGVVDGALPPFVFVAVSALAGSALHVPRQTAVLAAASAAAVTGLVLVGLRLARREPLLQALRGMTGLAIAAAVAARTGEARDYFLPGIYVDAAYAVVFAASVVAGWPLVGVVHSALYRHGRRWRADRRLRRAFAAATLGWSAVFAVRAGVQYVFYDSDRAGLLALAKLLLGWPLTLVALVATIAWLRRTARSGPTGVADADARPAVGSVQR